MYRAQVTNEGDSKFKVKTEDCEFVIDTKGAGCTPPDTLLASLGSCIGVYIRKYAEGAKLDISGFTVTVEGELSKEAPAAFRTINAVIKIQGQTLDERRIRSLLAFVSNCPVHNTLKCNPIVNVKMI